jgi:hypothetical protein
MEEDLHGVGLFIAVVAWFLFIFRFYFLTSAWMLI